MDLPDFNIGDTVYYVDNGPTDQGIVTDLRDNEVQVSFDSPIGDDDWYLPNQIHKV